MTEKNKKYVREGISLNFLGNDSFSLLVKEVISEAISKLENVDKNISDVKDTIHFLKLNFDIPDKEIKE